MIEIVVDFGLMVGSFLAAYLVIVDGFGDDVEKAGFLAALPIVLGTRYLCFVLGGIYRRVWRYATTMDELVVTLACVVSGLLSLVIIVLLRWVSSASRPRCSSRRNFRDAARGRLPAPLPALGRAGRHHGRDGARRVLIVGAGRSGRSLARELRETPGMRVVGFLDDNPVAARATDRRVARARAAARG